MSTKNNETRTRILKSARELLESGKASSVRMSDIAKLAGISRQAVYLHFPTRTDLLIATTRHLDDVHNIDADLVASRNATSGSERMNAFIFAWGNYIPEIYGMAKALMAMQGTDDAAKLAWEDRMAAVRHGCLAAINALHEEGKLSADHSVCEATDILWTLLSVQNWEQFTQGCGWSQTDYITTVQKMARKILLS